MKTKLTIVARIEAKKERINLVKSELIKLIKTTRKEDGCVQYDLHQDNDRPEVFLFYEIWESRELWQAHMKSAHLAEYKAATEAAIVDLTLNEMTLID